VPPAVAAHRPDTGRHGLVCPDVAQTLAASHLASLRATRRRHARQPAPAAAAETPLERPWRRPQMTVRLRNSALPSRALDSTLARSPYGAPHSTLHVTIRDASVSLTKVSAIAGAFESVSRDYKSGEILCGGYVSSHITAVMW
jgi:hypothetical protein